MAELGFRINFLYYEVTVAMISEDGFAVLLGVWMQKLLLNAIECS